MNPDLPNSPENRLLDELLHEQNHGPDTAFLQQIEAAVDANPEPAAKRPRLGAALRYGIAATVVLSAGSAVWWHSAGRRQAEPPALAQASRRESPSSGRHDAAALRELQKAIQNQEDKVEERRKVLATIVRTKGINFKGTDSFYNTGAVGDQGAMNALQAFHQLEQEKIQLESQIGSLLKYDDDQLNVYAAGLDLPDNVVRDTYPGYLETKRELEGLKVSGLGDDHPSVKATKEKADAMRRRIDEGVVDLRSDLKARLDLAKDRLKSVEVMKDETREEAIKRGLDAQDYVDAKRDFESDQQQLLELKAKLMELGGAGAIDTKTSPQMAPEAPKAEAKPAPPVHATKPETSSSDRYGVFNDQPWKNPATDPLSTFSIDVDTASYANVRRMIREGRQIPRGAVRIEDCINAFNYRYQPPKDGGAFAVGASLAACPWAPQHQLVRVAIKGREIDARKRPASNLVFLVDVSGSMQSPDKLPLLKQSMATLVRQLDERDRVAIVVYAGSEGVALPSTRLDAEGRELVLGTLSRLEAGGSTNGGAGINRAYELAMKEKIEGGVNRVILATDGDFNVGVTGQQPLVELVKDRARNGVYLTVLGYGSGNLNDSMMDAITRDGNGNYFYIDSQQEGEKVFLRNLTGTLVTIAKDVKIQIEFNPAKVGSYRLIGYASRVLRNEDFNNDKVDAGDIGAGHTVTAFYELTPPESVAGAEGLKYRNTPGTPAASDEWLTVKLRHKHPEGDDSVKTEFSLTGEAAPLEGTDPDFRFATAAALFGMKLRGMDEVADFGWDRVLALAGPGLADDAAGDRAEFVELVKTLGGIKTGSAPAPAEVLPNGK